MKLAIFACFFALAASHASMIMPPPRNAVDNDVGTPWSGGKHPTTDWIQPYTCFCTNGSEPTCGSGQACFWFSQGCTIGCTACDGKGARIPNWDHCPEEGPKRRTVDDPRFRSVNQNATPGSPEDIFKFNPWRAPGRAPVFDPCGKAGGSDTMAFNAGGYNTTKNARQGDLGTAVLKPRPSGTVWKRGAVEKARWQYTAAHGGGYQYRLCLASEPLTEACFQAMPLKFAEPASHTFKYADHDLVLYASATVVPDAVTGTGDWMLNPIPSYESDLVGCDVDCTSNDPAFGGGLSDACNSTTKHCKLECPGCRTPTWAADTACPSKCAQPYPQYFPSGNAYVGADKAIFPDPHGLSREYNKFAVEDSIVVPSDIPAGEYVLGWRWDCEQTTQIWASCADISIE